MRISAFRVRSSVTGNGTFFCPLEGADRSYVRSQVRRWFAPLGIPLIPWNRLGDYIRCAECHQTFTDDVLDIVTTHELSTTLETAAVGLISTIIHRSDSDRGVERAGRRELQRFVRDPERIELALPPPELVDVVEALTRAAVNMEEAGRRDLFAAAVRVAHADAPLSGPNFAVLHAAGGGLRIPMPDVRALIVSQGVPIDRG